MCTAAEHPFVDEGRQLGNTRSIGIAVVNVIVVCRAFDRCARANLLRSRTRAETLPRPRQRFGSRTYFKKCFVVFHVDGQSKFSLVPGNNSATGANDVCEYPG